MVAVAPKIKQEGYHLRSHLVMLGECCCLWLGGISASKCIRHSREKGQPKGRENFYVRIFLDLP